MKAIHLSLVCVVFPLIYIVVLVVYRLFYHPLSKFPGPKLAAATKWYECYYDLVKGNGGEFAWNINSMHEKYGSIVRVNPDELHVRNPDSYEIIYAKNPTHRDKWPPAASMAGTSLATFGTVDHDLHRKRRLAISHFFSKKFIHSAEGVFKDQVEHLSSILSSSYRNGNTLDLRVTYLAFTTDTVCRLAFGGSLGLQDNSNSAKDWAETMEAVARLTPIIKQFPFLISWVKKVPIPLLHFFVPALARLLKLHQSMHSRAREFLKEQESFKKAEKMEGRPEIFHLINESSLPPQEKTLKRIAQEGFALIAAGGETTARILTIATFHILENPAVLQQLQSDLNQAMSDRMELPGFGVLRELPWLTAVIKESLRIAAIITSRLPIMAPDELTIAGWTVPPNTPISMTINDVLLDPAIFPEPMKFSPERWLHNKENKGANLEQYLVAFSRGTRMCPGQEIAYTELYLTLAMIFRRFDLQLYETFRERDIDIQRDCFIGEPDPKTQGIRVQVVGMSSA